jgi:hypothetical protein
LTKRQRDSDDESLNDEQDNNNHQTKSSSKQARLDYSPNKTSPPTQKSNKTYQNTTDLSIDCEIEIHKVASTKPINDNNEGKSMFTPDDRRTFFQNLIVPSKSTNMLPPESPIIIKPSDNNTNRSNLDDSLADKIDLHMCNRGAATFDTPPPMNR